MATVHVTADPILLTIIAEGPLASADILRTIVDSYPSFAGNRILWDLTGSEVAKLSATDLADIAMAARQVNRRTGIRTAFVTMDRDCYGSISKYIADAAVAGVVTEYGVFADAAEAKQWLLESRREP